MHPQPQLGGVALPAPGARGGISCTADDATWAVLCGLADEVLFHPDLFPVLRRLPTLILEGDVRDAISDLVLNGFDV